MSTRDIFLTVDIDFWGCVTNIGQPLAFFDIIARNYKQDISLVYRHDQVLPLVNKYNSKFLINIDNHIDLYSNSFYVNHVCRCNDIDEYREACWVNMIENIRGVNYYWYHNHEDYHNGVFHTWNNPTVHNNYLNTLTIIRGLPRIQSIPWDRVAHINICYSPTYLADEGAGWVLAQALFPMDWTKVYAMRKHANSLPLPPVFYISPDRLAQKELEVKMCEYSSLFLTKNRLRYIHYNHKNDKLYDVFTRKPKEYVYQTLP